MKVLCSVILLLAAIASSHGYSYLIPARQSQGGACYFNGHVLSKGDTQMPTVCQNLRCNEDGSILVQGCGRLNLKGCTLLGPAKTAASYPDCCEMKYECKDREGRVFMRQWNQLKAEGGLDEVDEGQSVASNLQQTSEAINAAQELLDQIRQQAQRDGRIDLGGQSDRVETELLILREIVERQGQLANRSPLEDAQRQRLDRERRIQLARMENELSTLVKISKGVARFSERQRMESDLQAKQEVKAVIELIAKELLKRGQLDDLNSQLLRLEEEMEKFALLKSRQAQQIQVGRKETQDQEIARQAGLVQQELAALLQMSIDKMGEVQQLDDPRNCLDVLVETIQRQARLQSPEVRVQLSRALNELEILSQIKARQQGIRSDLNRENLRQEIKAQLGRVDSELRILAQKWARKVNGSEPISRIVRLIQEQISRFIPQQSSELKAQLELIEKDLQYSEGGQTLEDERVQEDLKVLLQILSQSLRQAPQGSRIEEDVLPILLPVRDRLQRSGRRSGRFQSFAEEQPRFNQGLDQQVKDKQLQREIDQLTRILTDFIRTQVNKQRIVFIPEIRVEVNRLQSALQMLSLIRVRQNARYEQGGLIQSKVDRMQEEIVYQQRKIEREMQTLVKAIIRGLNQGELSDFQRQVVGGSHGPECLKLKEQADRVEEELRIFYEIKGEQRLDQAGAQEGLQAEEVEEGLEGLDRQQGLEGQQERRGQRSQRGQQRNRGQRRQRIQQGQVNQEEQQGQQRQFGQQGKFRQQGQRVQQGQELTLILQRERVEREVRTLVQMWSLGMRTFENSREPEQNIQDVLKFVQDLIQKKGGTQFPKLSANLNRIERGFESLNQMRGRQIQGLASQVQQQEDEIKALQERVEYDQWTVLQILAEGLQRDDQQDQIELEVRTLLALVGNRIRSDNLAARAQLNSLEEELRILAQIDARLIKRAIEGIRDRGQDDIEVKVQVDRVKKNLMILVRLLARSLEQAGEVDDLEEGVRAVLDIVSDQVDRQGEGVRDQFQRVGKMLAMNRLSKGLQGSQYWQQGRYIEKEVILLIQMIGQEIGLDGQIEREGRAIMDLIKQEQRQVRPTSEQLERVEMELEALDQQTGQGEKNQQRDRLERELRTLLTMMQMGDETAQRSSTNPKIASVKLSRNVSDNSFQRERLEEKMQTLDQLKRLLSTASGDQRLKVEQQIDEQRDQIERELRTIFKIRDMKAALHDFLSTMRNLHSRHAI